MNWPTTPTHVLLVGDANIAPVQYFSGGGYTFTYDDYFVELTGNDFFPEMMIGRFTNQVNNRLTAMMSKMIGYEKTPYITDPDWFRKGLVCSNNVLLSQIQTKSFTRHEMLMHGNFLSVDSMYNGTPCPGNVTTIVNMINAGRGFLNYRGEGWFSGWWASCFPFSTSDVNNLNNGAKLTFVTSIGCGVANFDSAPNNFGETWMEIGEVNAPRGACAFVGPVSNTYADYNNEIDKGIYIGMFEEGLDSPGEALLRGKFHMYEIFGSTDTWVNYHYKIYHVLGDPSLHIWKYTPKSINVTYTDTIPDGTSQVQATVTYAATGLPAADVLICISGGDVYSVGYTQADGTAVLTVNPPFAGQLSITASGGYCIPFEGTIQVLSVNTFPLSVSVSNGWNMVSIPGVNPNGQGVNNWWPGHTGQVFTFVPGSGYTEVTTTTPGKGYWMKNSGDNVYNTGDEWPAGIQVAAHDPVNVSTGWNMFGGYEDIVDPAALTTTPAGQIIYPLYNFIPGSGYQAATQIVPGYGYWVKISSACQINVPDLLMAKSNQRTNGFFKNNLPDDKVNWGRIIVTDATGNSYTLYAVKGDSPNGGAEVDLDTYELPPLPPEGLFDVRFGSGRVAEDINSTVQTIEMRGVKYPVKVKVENMDIKLTDVTGKQMNTNIKSGEEITISSSNIDKVMVTAPLIPDKYSLEQNYPNPFNPGTTIGFSIPENVKNVKLSIYNILGEKVAELVNGSKQAGKYQYQWNAKDFASGTYIYELRTEKFVSIKKMILLK